MRLLLGTSPCFDRIAHPAGVYCAAGFRSCLCQLRVKIGHCGDVRRMTTFPPKAEVHPQFCYVAKVPKAVSCTAASRISYSTTSSASNCIELGTSQVRVPKLRFICS